MSAPVDYRLQLENQWVADYADPLWPGALRYRHCFGKPVIPPLCVMNEHPELYEGLRERILQERAVINACLEYI